MKNIFTYLSALSVLLMSAFSAIHAADALPVLVLPLRIHLMQSATQPKLNTTLTETDVQRILAKVNRIWSQAGIRFEAESVRKTGALVPPQPENLKTMPEQLKAVVPVDSLGTAAINICYVKELVPNGFYCKEAIAVKDTARLDEVEGGLDEPIPRVTSHELGHALGLNHRQDRTNLMASGKNGFLLNEAEIAVARAKAQVMLEEWKRNQNRSAVP